VADRVNPFVVAATPTRRGVSDLGLPHRQVGQLAVLARWGFGLAGSRDPTGHGIPA
jgi:hypothetical protein